MNGSTEVVSLFDLAQILSVNEATGMLKVESDGSRGYLYFQDGAIINAMDDLRGEGEEAAKGVFSMTSARFSFGSDLPSVARRITASTQSLLMEIARQLDEESAGDDEDGPGFGERLRESAAATRELHDIFTRLDSEAKVASLRIPDGFGVADLLDAIRGSEESVLYLRLGAPPEAQAGGRMIRLSENPLSPEGFRQLRQALLEGGNSVAAALGGAEDRVFTFGDEGRYRAEACGSSATPVLRVQWLPDPQSLIASLPWPVETLNAFLREPGSLVLVTGADPFRLSRGVEAAVAHQLTANPGPFVGIGRRWLPGLGEYRAAAVLLATAGGDDAARARALVDQLSPSLFAVKDSDQPDIVPVVLHALRRGARVLLGVCAGSVSQVPHRLLESLPADQRDGFVRQLGASLSGVLRPPESQGTPGEAWLAEESVRVTLLDGDLSALVAELSSLGADSLPG